MDISEISRERTLIDLVVARARIVSLTSEIDSAGAELADLRTELAEARGPLESEPTGSGASRGSVNALGKLRFWRRSGGQHTVQWHIDEICGHAPLKSGAVIAHSVRKSDSWAMTISGWAVPNGQSQAFTSARINMTGPGGSITRQASIHLRDDVAAHFGNPSFAMSGFRFEVPMSELAAGSYALELAVFSDGSGETAVHVGRIELA